MFCAFKTLLFVWWLWTLHMLVAKKKHSSSLKCQTVAWERLLHVLNKPVQIHYSACMSILRTSDMMVQTRFTMMHITLMKPYFLNLCTVSREGHAWSTKSCCPMAFCSYLMHNLMAFFCSSVTTLSTHFFQVLSINCTKKCFVYGNVDRHSPSFAPLFHQMNSSAEVGNVIMIWKFQVGNNVWCTKY